LTKLLQKRAVSVENEGELVILMISGMTWSLDFVVALELAAMMKREARYAKASAGDEGVRRHVAGVLHDAAAERKHSGRAKRLPERLKARNISVNAEGSIVKVRLGTSVLGIPYVAAPQIAQWLRIRGKIARNSAGEKAHWSKLVQPNVLEQRA
jgi:hypothetical protein